MSGLDHTSAGRAPAFARRKVLAGGMGVAAAVVLAGCGDDDDPAEATPTSDEATSEPTDSSATEPSTGTDLGPAADVAVGSGVVFADEKVVVTQPTEGVFRAFDTACTHTGCPVDEVTDTINCPCHGSMFSLDDGAPLSGPATAPLAAKDVTVEDGSLLLG